MANEHVTPMDYAEHERSYETFTKFTVLGIVACLNIVLVLLMVAKIGWISPAVFLVLTLAAVALGILADKSWVPSGVVFVLAALFCVFNLVH